VRILFQEARRRRRRRWLARIAVALVTVTVAVTVAVTAVTWLHRSSGHGGGSPGAAGAVRGQRPSTAAVWVDDSGGLHVGYIQPGRPAQMTQHVVAEVNAAALPLVRAGDRVYWVNPAGTFVPALGHWSAIVQYLDVVTGEIGTAGPGQTVFLSADGRELLMSQTATVVTERPLAGGGGPRNLTLPRGWYLPGGDGLASLVGGEGLATANGIIVESQEGPGSDAPVLAVWNPRNGRIEVIGRDRAVIGAYTPPRARYSLLAWLPAACPSHGDCPVKITNTATLAVRTVASPLPDGFAAGGAFSPDGTRLAVFVKTAAGRAARPAVIDMGTGAVRMPAGHRLPLGLDVGWARWLPDGTHVLVGTGTGGYELDSVTLSARPLLVTSSRDRSRGDSQDVNYSVAVVPLHR
jgi:hypothetical protein